MTAKYIEIAADLRERIRGGEFTIGSRLPGIPRLQNEYGVAGLNTIRAAQRVLIEEGLLRTEQGVGTYVVGTPTSEAQAPVLLQELRIAQQAIARAITALEAS